MCIALLVAVVGALLIPNAAQAGVYTVHACRAGDWKITRQSASLDTYSSTCPSGSLELAMRADKAHPADGYIRARFLAPSGTSIQAYRLWRAAQLSWPYNYSLYEAGTNAGFDGCFDTCTGKGNWMSPHDSANLVASGWTQMRGIDILLACGVPDSAGGSCEKKWPGARFRLFGADITLRDDTIPTDVDVSGELVRSSRRFAGVQPVTISAQDSGSGVYEALFEVDGAVVDQAIIDRNGGKCVAPFTWRMPCRAGTNVNGTVGFDTSRVADGTHRLRILVTDATGTNRTAWGPVVIRTANASCSPKPRTRGLKIRAGVRRGRRLHRTVTKSYSGRVRIRGRVLTPQGSPVAGARLCVGARTDVARARVRRIGSVVTNARGRFTYRVRRGPTRRFYFVRRAPSGAIAASVLVRARASTSFRASQTYLRTGDTVHFSGRLRGRPLPRRGRVLVELQARRDDGWSTFGTVQANRRGRFHYSYRFVRTRGVQSYSLRARVPKQASYPFATGASKPLALRVSG